MSLSGQWITRYTGSNTGTLVIELDEAGGHYEGTAIAWDEAGDHFNALVRLRTPSKEDVQHLKNVPVIIIDNVGETVNPSVLRHLYDSQNITYPCKTLLICRKYLAVYPITCSI
jgi:hypothetical protein